MRPPSQFKKALCFEKMEKFDAACEEYVKLTYLYPDSGYVVDATLRLGNYYYKKAPTRSQPRSSPTSSRRTPRTRWPPRPCSWRPSGALKQKSYLPAAKLFAALVEQYQDDKALRAEAMYWMADAYFQANDHVNAYRGFKRLTWDYPDSEWAKFARGRLSEESFSTMKDE